MAHAADRCTLAAAHCVDVGGANLRLRSRSGLSAHVIQYTHGGSTLSHFGPAVNEVAGASSALTSEVIRSPGASRRPHRCCRLTVSGSAQQLHAAEHSRLQRPDGHPIRICSARCVTGGGDVVIDEAHPFDAVDITLGALVGDPYLAEVLRVSRLTPRRPTTE